MTEFTPAQSKRFDEMIAFLASVYPISSALKAAIKAKVRFLKVRKGQHLLRAGEINRDLYFISQGLLRCYYYTEDGTEVSTWFMWEHDVCVSINSFYLQIEGYEFIQAIEPSQLFCISHEDLKEIYLTHMEFNYIRAELTIKYLIDWSNQLKDIRLLETDDRYKALLQRDPDRVRRIPKKYLASFLNMVPTSLSRSSKPLGKKRR
jgi:CRP/FNR family transcriptional regulator, anaerobic regulatory protein